MDTDKHGCTCNDGREGTDERRQTMEEEGRQGIDDRQRSK